MTAPLKITKQKEKTFIISYLLQVRDGWLPNDDDTTEFLDLEKRIWCEDCFLHIVNDNIEWRMKGLVTLFLWERGIDPFI